MVPETKRLKEDHVLALIRQIATVDSKLMWTRDSCDRAKEVVTHRPYIAKFIAMALELINNAGYHEIKKLRKIQYMLGSKAFSA